MVSSMCDHVLFIAANHNKHANAYHYLYIYIMFEGDPAEGRPNKSYAVTTARSLIGKLRTVESKSPGKFL